MWPGLYHRDPGLLEYVKNLMNGGGTILFGVGVGWRGLSWAWVMEDVTLRLREGN